MMAIGALLNSLSAVSSSMSVISSGMTALGSIASDIGGFLSDAFGKAMEAGTKAYKKIKEAFDEYLGPTWKWMKEKGSDAFNGLMVIAEGTWNGLVMLWNSVVMPIWDFLKDAVSLVFAFITGDWGRVIELLTKHWEERVLPTITGLTGIFSSVMDTVRNLASSAWTWIGDKFDEHIAPLWGNFSEKFSRIIDSVRGHWSNFVTKFFTTGSRSITGNSNSSGYIVLWIFI